MQSVQFTFHRYHFGPGHQACHPQNQVTVPDIRWSDNKHFLPAYLAQAVNEAGNTNIGQKIKSKPSTEKMLARQSLCQGSDGSPHKGLTGMIYVRPQDLLTQVSYRLWSSPPLLCGSSQQKTNCSLSFGINTCIKLSSRGCLTLESQIT